MFVKVEGFYINPRYIEGSDIHPQLKSTLLHGPVRMNKHTDVNQYIDLIKKNNLDLYNYLNNIPMSILIVSILRGTTVKNRLDVNISMRKKLTKYEGDCRGIK
jgi:hypothetical protein